VSVEAEVSWLRFIIQVMREQAVIDQAQAAA